MLVPVLLVKILFEEEEREMPAFEVLVPILFVKVLFKDVIK